MVKHVVHGYLEPAQAMRIFWSMASMIWGFFLKSGLSSEGATIADQREVMILVPLMKWGASSSTTKAGERASVRAELTWS